jgi:Uncharacterized membrane protein, required for colicin V production
MNILDYIILGLITFFIVKGIFRGFFREISSLAGIIFGIWIGNHYYPQMANLLKAYIPLEKSLSLISFLLLFIVVVILSNLSGMLLHHLFKKLLIAWLDRGWRVSSNIYIPFQIIHISYFYLFEPVTEKVKVERSCWPRKAHRNKPTFFGLAYENLIHVYHSIVKTLRTIKRILLM